MTILLLSMPDSFEHTPTLTMRMPNGALGSLAGNLDDGHRVAIADLVLVQDAVGPTVDRLVDELQPDLVGLSVMTFQRRTAGRIIRRIRARRPGVRIIVGGYDPSLAAEAYEADDMGVDFIVRGEGEVTLRELVRALDTREPDIIARLGAIPGLSFRGEGGWVRNVSRPAHVLAHDELRLPNRRARVLAGYTICGRPVDVVETSRGCTYDCSFCSIIEMRGRNFHSFGLDRVIADIADAHANGARAIFFVDDNITLDVRRFEALCRAIVDAGLNDIDYLVQGMTSAIAAHGQTLAPLMRRAGFRYVFLGIENVLEGDLAFLKASAKNASRREGRTVGNASVDAIRHLHAHGMFVVGGLIVGNPSDTREAIETNLAFAHAYVDWPYIQHPTPYPGTPMTADFVRRGLIVNDRLEEYDGTTAVVRSEHLDADDIEALRWRAERPIKARHFFVVVRHDPWFAVRHGIRMFRHLFRGTSLRWWLGLEDDRRALARFREIRRREREFLDDVAPAAIASSPRHRHTTAGMRELSA
ncbi:MAG: radical SAM protein [Vicinamibacterales bacterium]